MSYKASEKEFYLRHYDGGIAIKEARDLTEIEKQMFAAGGRYHLLVDTISERHAPPGLLVEIGCGNGDSLFYLKQKFKFKRVVGIDIALPDALHEVEGIEFLSANFDDGLPFAEGQVDVLTAMMVVEHLFDPFFAFREVKRVLAKDGIAVLNLPLVTAIANRWRLLMGNLPITSVPFERWMVDEEWDGNHLHYFSLQSIHRLAEKSGLAVTSLAGVGRAHKLKTLMPKLLASELTFVLEHR